MPAYPWLFKREINTKYTAAKIKTLQMLNTPYGENYADIAVQDLEKQAQQIVAELKAESGIEQEGLETKQIIALIAYLQRLGTDAQAQDISESE